MFFIPSFVRFLIHFVFVFFILLIPIGGGENLFDFLDGVTVSSRHYIIKKSSEIASSAWSGTKRMGKKLFTNAGPSQVSIKQDRVQTRQSKTQRKSKNSSLSKVIKREELEHIGEDDMRRLDQFLAD